MIEQVLQEMLALKAAANDSKSEVESLRRAKFRTPIQLLFPDQFDGGSMITSVKVRAVFNTSGSHGSQYLDCILNI